MPFLDEQGLQRLWENIVAEDASTAWMCSPPSGSSNFGGYRPVICISKTASVV